MLQVVVPVDTCPLSATLLRQLQVVPVVVVVLKPLVVRTLVENLEQSVRETMVETVLHGPAATKDLVVVVVPAVQDSRQTQVPELPVQVE
jgi:hypothetical protein